MGQVVKAQFGLGIQYLGKNSILSQGCKHLMKSEWKNLKQLFICNCNKR